MIWVGIETTSGDLGLGVYEEASSGQLRVVGEFSKVAVAQQAELLVPTLNRLLKKKKSDIGAIAVDIGPGSFTGVRVGLAAGRTIAHALSIPLVGVCSLEAMAEQAPARASLIGAVRPALKGDVYVAAYQNGRVVLDPCWKTETWWQQWLKGRQIKLVTKLPTARSLVDVARRRYDLNPSSAEFKPQNIHALYLQPSWAERSLHGINAG